jgi:hypothetical protein
MEVRQPDVCFRGKISSVRVSGPTLTIECYWVAEEDEMMGSKRLSHLQRGYRFHPFTLEKIVKNTPEELAFTTALLNETLTLLSPESGKLIGEPSIE